ncbi:hypothetical protein, partial [Oleiphilus sp. HI0128]
ILKSMTDFRHLFSKLRLFKQTPDTEHYVKGTQGDKFMYSQFTKALKVIMFSLVLALPATGWSNTIEETPSAVAMTGDALFVRPVMIATTILGAAIFIVSSPFSALGGNVEESFDELVAGPFNTAFIRCLGCTMTGRKVSAIVSQEEE